MDGVEAVHQRHDTQLHWVVSHKDRRHEFGAEISDQRPDERIAWKTTDGTSHAGTATFKRLDGARCTVTVQMDWQPEGCWKSSAPPWGPMTAAPKRISRASKK